MGIALLLNNFEFNAATAIMLNLDTHFALCDSRVTTSLVGRICSGASLLMSTVLHHKNVELLESVPYQQPRSDRSRNSNTSFQHPRLPRNKQHAVEQFCTYSTIPGIVVLVLDCIIPLVLLHYCNFCRKRSLLQAHGNNWTRRFLSEQRHVRFRRTLGGLDRCAASHNGKDPHHFANLHYCHCWISAQFFRARIQSTAEKQ